MSVSPALRRLLSVLALEEEQAQRALEAAAGELRRLEQAHAAARERERAGRLLEHAGILNGAATDRLAGREEALLGRRLAATARARMAETEKTVVLLREGFLAKRLERRQAETLMREAEQRESIESERRAQQRLDDWFLQRRHRPE